MNDASMVIANTPVTILSSHTVLPWDSNNQSIGVQGVVAWYLQLCLGREP